jgi:hypothetical protein
MKAILCPGFKPNCFRTSRGITTWYLEEMVAVYMLYIS